MKRARLGASLLGLGLSVAAHSEIGDARLLDVDYDPHAIVSVPVRSGVVTMIALDPSESIAEVAAGMGGDCSKPEAAWCMAAAPGGHDLFVKPKSSAAAPNNVDIVTTTRTYVLRLEPIADRERREPVYRLSIRLPSARVAATPIATRLPPTPAGPREPAPRELVRERLKAKPQVRNSDYSIAEGDHAQDIVPTLVFDDGRFTYLRFPGNRAVPAVFQVLDDDSETVVNARMEDDLLVVDRVSRRLVLRSGSAVVEVWNDAFTADGLPPVGATTVPGVQRVLRRDGSAGDADDRAEAGR